MHNDADQTVHGVGRVYDGIDLFPIRKRDFAGRPLPVTEVIAGIIVVLGTVEFALRYYQMKLAQAQNESDL